MTIDIVDLTDEKYADLNAVQMAMVRAAQVKKNEIVAEADEEKASIQRQLVANNFARSYVQVMANARINTAQYKAIEALKEDLDYQLAYESLGSEGNEQGPYRYPENPNYNLTPSQRFLVVREYYMSVTDDPDARLKAYTVDSLARTYLGKYSATLYDLLASYCGKRTGPAVAGPVFEWGEYAIYMAGALVDGAV